MAEEIVRKLVNGEWVTTVENQSGGGGGSQSLADVLAVGNDGNGVQVKNLAAGTDPDDAATVSQLGGGSQPTYVQDADPGAVGAGATWLNTTDPTYGVPSTVRPLLVRNAADDGWDELGLIHRDGGGNVRGFISLSDGGIVIRAFDAGGDPQGEFFMLGDHIGIWSTDGGRIDIGYPGEEGGVSISPSSNPNSWGVAESGAEYLNGIDAPDDGDVPNGQRHQWFDKMNGAPKLRFKERDNAGTLTTGVSASEEYVQSYIADGGFFSVGGGNQAAFVDPLTATAGQVAQALIDANLMASS